MVAGRDPRGKNFLLLVEKNKFKKTSKLQPGKKRQVGWFPATFVKINEPDAPAAAAAAAAAPSAATEEVRALFPYAGQQDDELAFEEGDVITVTAKNGEWWTGELRGKEGVFPANFVEPVAK